MCTHLATRLLLTVVHTGVGAYAAYHVYADWKKDRVVKDAIDDVTFGASKKYT